MLLYVLSKLAIPSDETLLLTLFFPQTMSILQSVMIKSATDIQKVLYINPKIEVFVTHILDIQEKKGETIDKYMQQHQLLSKRLQFQNSKCLTKFKMIVLETLLLVAYLHVLLGSTC